MSERGDPSAYFCGVRFLEFTQIYGTYSLNAGSERSNLEGFSWQFTLGGLAISFREVAVEIKSDVSYQWYLNPDAWQAHDSLRHDR